LLKKMKMSIRPIWVHLNQLRGSGVAEVWGERIRMEEDLGGGKETGGGRGW
jgi:hypothetical protein